MSANISSHTVKSCRCQVCIVIIILNVRSYPRVGQAATHHGISYENRFKTERVTRSKTPLKLTKVSHPPQRLHVTERREMLHESYDQPLSHFRFDFKTLLLPEKCYELSGHGTRPDSHTGRRASLANKDDQFPSACTLENW